MEKIGIFAGQGEIVSLAVEEIKKMNKEPIIFSFYELRFQDIKFHKIGFGSLDEFLDKAQKEQISKIVLVGQIHPQELFKRQIDSSGEEFLKSFNTIIPENILLNFIKHIEKYKIKTIPLTKIFKSYIAKENVYSSEKPDQKHWIDISFAWKIAKTIAQKKIGQAVSVKNGIVIAVEGIEGTDEMIKRTGNYCHDFTVIKVIRKGQSTKFDLPTIGPDTIENFSAAKGKVLAFEAGKTIILNEEKIKALADKNRVIVLGYKGRKGLNVN